VSGGWFIRVDGLLMVMPNLVLNSHNTCYCFYYTQKLVKYPDKICDYGTNARRPLKTLNMVHVTSFKTKLHDSSLETWNDSDW
jgi:hypothetical protein